MICQFKYSSSKIGQIPDHRLEEFAVIGRSNVGKSSLINMLAQQPVAKVSATPGKTRLINHFEMDGRWMLVDLPGYGYAKASRGTVNQFSKLITDYVTKAPRLHMLFVLIDIRHAPMQIDIDFMMMLGNEGIPFGIVFTKCDKLKPSVVKENIATYCKCLSEWWEQMPPMFTTSSQHKQGREELLKYIDNCLSAVDK